MPMAARTATPIQTPTTMPVGKLTPELPAGVLLLGSVGAHPVQAGDDDSAELTEDVALDGSTHAIDDGLVVEPDSNTRVPRKVPLEMAAWHAGTAHWSRHVASVPFGVSSRADSSDSSTTASDPLAVTAYTTAVAMPADDREEHPGMALSRV